MQDHLKTRFKIFLVVFFTVMVFGTLGFMYVEKKSLADSFYFVIVTMATVGYGDIHPVTGGGKAIAIVIIVMGVSTFLGVIANATEMMLAKREMEARMQKLNMVIGVFFSEVGVGLLDIFSHYDPEFDSIRPGLIVTANWTDRDFQRAIKDSRDHAFGVRMEVVDLSSLKGFLMERRDFLVRLLENPVLMEHQSFTDLLRAVFHLTEELAYRKGFEDIPRADSDHLAGDIKRSYHLIVGEWLVYMKYLRNNYPFLFSLAIRTNPFDTGRSVTVKG
ncbi:MAG TPA: potassium channel family protein [Syntrophorhabdaceae bacterium]|nr:potassium channel family protein [Syntrophorhabdaceae bacterium]